MANPFDLRSALLARHAQHVVLIHFPIALFLTGVLLDLFSRLKRDSRLATAAQVNFAAAAICVLPAYFTGLLAWKLTLEGQHIKGILLYHLIAASTTVVFVMTTWWARSRTPLRPVFTLALEFAGAISISLTAHLGGFLSGVNT